MWFQSGFHHHWHVFGTCSIIKFYKTITSKIVIPQNHRPEREHMRQPFYTETTSSKPARLTIQTDRKVYVQSFKLIALQVLAGPLRN